MEMNPRALFERLFGDGDSTDRRPACALKDQSSILDYITATSIAWKPAWASATAAS